MVHRAAKLRFDLSEIGSRPTARDIGKWTEHARDPAGFAFYMAKEQRASSAPETMLFLEDVFPTKG